jgi:hypothetical protein
MALASEPKRSELYKKHSPNETDALASGRNETDALASVPNKPDALALGPNKPDALALTVKRF